MFFRLHSAPSGDGREKRTLKIFSLNLSNQLKLGAFNVSRKNVLGLEQNARLYTVLFGNMTTSVSDDPKVSIILKDVFVVARH